ncbi:DUF3306 domain-containing protein [Chelativorans sp. M5D2P16]|uniref:DUF3306 domain-containing protein n=1 Tax=Chelativorans sp. M5D2P16 TaxID=3095678 RepID=UPI002ACA8D3C|nr:DUF3306 domain-containing protein [Chelativorans sp. M5D2P16]MDZ5698601.1 DUF3306 domain-containing protein [Chelativorans sp. M5D2P16]
MTSRDDNPLARWSRRKQAARKAEAPARDEARDAVPEEEEERVETQLPATEPDAAEPPEPLPRLEDLTPESDLTAFLRKGVPAALRNTALRKMWSLDPVIRNYVGPAEYAWDFNKPGSMPGFGPLEAGKSVANFLSKVGGSDPKGGADEPEEPPKQEALAPSDPETATSPDEAAEASAPAEPAKPAERPETLQSKLSQKEVAEASPSEDPAPAGTHEASARPRHGGALPR